MLFIVIVLDVATGQVPAQALQGEICQVPIIGEKRVKEVSWNDSFVIVDIKMGDEMRRSPTRWRI